MGVLVDLAGQTLVGGARKLRHWVGVPFASDDSLAAAAVSLFDSTGAAIGAGNPVPVNVITNQADKTASGTITTTTPTNVAIVGGGLGEVSVVITGTWTGTLNFQVSGDGTNWVAVDATVPSTGAAVTSTTANGTWQISAAGFNGVRVLGPTSTGSATVNLESTPVGDQVTLLPGTSVIGQVRLLDGAGTSVAVGKAAAAASLPVVLPNEQTSTAGTPAAQLITVQGSASGSAVPVSFATSATGAKTNVAGSASSVTILALNASRKGAMVYNDSTAILYLDLTGGTASTTSYSVQVPSQSLFELPNPTLYTGLITGIWGSATGNARVTEFS